MKDSKVDFGYILFLVFVGFAARIIPHSPNFTPIAAIALFSGSHFSKKYSFLIPIAVMLLSDIFLGFNKSTLTVYLCFIITTFLGFWLKNNKNFKNVVTASLLSSVIFYLVTNFNYWYAAPLYTKDISGLVTSYLAALPFFKNTITGDIIYNGVFFGLFALTKNLFKNKKLIFS